MGLVNGIDSNYIYSEGTRKMKNANLLKNPCVGAKIGSKILSNVWL